MADGRSGLTPGAEVNTIPPVSNQGSRFRPIIKAIARMDGEPRNRARGTRPIKQDHLQKVA
jgi:hypothetical protein